MESIAPWIDQRKHGMSHAKLFHSWLSKNCFFYPRWSRCCAGAAACGSHDLQSWDCGGRNQRQISSPRNHWPICCSQDPCHWSICFFIPSSPAAVLHAGMKAYSLLRWGLSAYQTLLGKAYFTSMWRFVYNISSGAPSFLSFKCGNLYFTAWLDFSAKIWVLHKEKISAILHLIVYRFDFVNMVVISKQLNTSHNTLSNTHHYNLFILLITLTLTLTTYHYLTTSSSFFSTFRRCYTSTSMCWGRAVLRCSCSWAHFTLRWPLMNATWTFMWTYLGRIRYCSHSGHSTFPHNHVLILISPIIFLPQLWFWPAQEGSGLYISYGKNHIVSYEWCIS